VFQIPYSALERTHEAWITATAQAGIGTVIRGGVARGEPGVGLGGSGRWRVFDAAQLNALCAEGESRTEFLLRFTLTHPHTQTIIVGTLHPGHLAENLQAIKRGPLSPEVYAEVQRRLDAVGERPAAVA